MASKITTDNPKHHKYVVVNKVERKKFPRKLIKLVSLFFPRWMHEAKSGWRWHHHSDGIFSTCHPYLKKGTKIIYDDCNHKSYRVMKKCLSGWRFVADTIHTMKNRGYNYYNSPYRTHFRYVRQCNVTNDRYSVKHYKRSQAYAY